MGTHRHAYRHALGIRHVPFGLAEANFLPAWLHPGTNHAVGDADVEPVQSRCRAAIEPNSCSSRYSCCSASTLRLALRSPPRLLDAMCNAAKAAIRPPTQCVHLCNMAKYAMWPHMQYSRACHMQYGHMCNVFFVKHGAAVHYGHP